MDLALLTGSGQSVKPTSPVDGLSAVITVIKRVPVVVEEELPTPGTRVVPHSSD